MKGFLIPSCLLWDNMGQKVVGLWKKNNRKDGNMKKENQRTECPQHPINRTVRQLHLQNKRA